MITCIWLGRMKEDFSSQYLSMPMHSQTSVLEVTTSEDGWISIRSDGEGTQPGFSKRVQSNKVQPSAKILWEEAVCESPTTRCAKEKGWSHREPWPPTSAGHCSYSWLHPSATCSWKKTISQRAPFSIATWLLHWAGSRQDNIKQ